MDVQAHSHCLLLRYKRYSLARTCVVTPAECATDCRYRPKAVQHDFKALYSIRNKEQHPDHAITTHGRIARHRGIAGQLTVQPDVPH